MMPRIVMVILFVGTILLPRCNSVEADGGAESVPVNIFKNSSFESFGKPSFDSWNALPGSSPLLSIEAVAPPTGGRYSLGLRDSYDDSPVVYQTAPARYGTHIYQLSLWFKGSLMNAAEISWDIKNGDSSQFVWGSRMQENGWYFYSFRDTLTCTSHDSIRVVFWPQIYDDEEGIVYFDLVKVEIVQ